MNRQQKLRDAGFDPSDPIVTAAARWVDRYNARQSDDRYCLTGANAFEFVRRCVAARLDPDREGVSAFVRQGQLVWAPSPDTYYARAEATGRYVTTRHRTEERGRTGVVVAICEVDHVVTVGDVAQVVTAVGEANVDQWKKQQNANKGWWANAAEHMCLIAAMHMAMRAAFPRQFRCFDADADVDSSPDQQTPTPTLPAARPATTPPAKPGPPADARAALRDPDRRPPSIPTPPVGARPSTAADELVGAFADAGYSELDAESIALRVCGVALDGLDDNGRRLLVERALPNRPATAAEWDQVCDIRDALPAEQFVSIVDDVVGYRGADVTFATTDQARQIISRGREATRGQFG